MGVAFFSSFYPFLPCFPEQHKNPEQSGETKALRFAKMTSFVVVRSSRDAGRMTCFFFFGKFGPWVS
jgi:hypothetical protein